MNAILATHDLAVGYVHNKHVTTLLQGLNLTLNAGELVALLGQMVPASQRCCVPSLVLHDPLGAA